MGEVGGHWAVAMSHPRATSEPWCKVRYHKNTMIKNMHIIYAPDNGTFAMFSSLVT